MTASPLESWSALEVTNLTATLKMPSEVAEQFRSNAISGRDLASLSDDDLTKELGLTSLQVRKLPRLLCRPLLPRLPSVRRRGRPPPRLSPLTWNGTPA
ncbi:lysine-specific demethylase JMJ16 isoform E [Micractinium conductrix]|uniref:Lysine-specific demethylase JMJ16 isoform E n=1 Tax=Micractinium conductrix TaxID=554055 RepID=A0A2P6VDZ7_9CHLO|nr:lysine-specific demethylase JMJ16 isoform E [Micractinium conductrix]|eukprot:PSC72308.1 lysine-specific demethylase JMJ16 isoform E [Micractinium conductrix]